MDTAALLTQARHAANLSQETLAQRAHTSRPTLSAYEHGHKSPSLETAARLLREAGFELCIRRRLDFVDHTTSRGRVVTVPTHLPELPTAQALATVTLPLHLNWSQRNRHFHLSIVPTGLECMKQSSAKVDQPISPPTSTAPCSSICGTNSCCLKECARHGRH